MIAHDDDDWASVGIFHLQTAVQIMNLLVDNDLVNREVMAEMIQAKIRESGNQLEQAIWETYVDFLKPEFNPPKTTGNVITFPEGSDIA
jgi:CTP-dependent riboflavin kinase